MNRVRTHSGRVQQCLRGAGGNAHDPRVYRAAADDIPTWTGRVSLRWHFALVAGLILGYTLVALIGEVL